MTEKQEDLLINILNKFLLAGIFIALTVFLSAFVWVLLTDGLAK